MALTDCIRVCTNTTAGRNLVDPLVLDLEIRFLKSQKPVEPENRSWDNEIGETIERRMTWSFYLLT